MGLIFKTLYVYIANLGILVTSIFKSFFKLIFKGLQKLFKFNKASFSSAKTFFKRSISFILIFTVLTVSVFYIISTDEKIDAVAITFNDEIVGFARSQNEAEHAKNMALKALGLTSDKKLDTKEVKTEPYNLKNSDTLSDALAQKIAPDRICVTEIYFDNELFCAVTDRQKAREFFYQQLKKAQKVIS